MDAPISASSARAAWPRARSSSTAATGSARRSASTRSTRTRSRTRTRRSAARSRTARASTGCSNRDLLAARCARCRWARAHARQEQGRARARRRNRLDAAATPGGAKLVERLDGKTTLQRLGADTCRLALPRAARARRAPLRVEAGGTLRGSAGGGGVGAKTSCLRVLRRGSSSCSASRTSRSGGRTNISTASSRSLPTTSGWPRAAAAWAMCSGQCCAWALALGRPAGARSASVLCIGAALYALEHPGFPVGSAPRRAAEGHHDLLRTLAERTAAAVSPCSCWPASSAPTGS